MYRPDFFIINGTEPRAAAPGQFGFQFGNAGFQ